MADLHWFPFFAKDWLSSPARMAMTPAQRGAYIDLLAFAWGNGDAEPCLDPAPEILSGLSGLGRDWKKLSPLILAQFSVRDGLLYNAKLSSVWEKSQEQHTKAVERGKKGGRPRKHPLKPVLSPTERSTEVAGNPSSSREAVSLTEKQASVASGLETDDGALALDAPAPSERPMEDRGRITDGKATPFREMVAQAMANLRPRVA